ncbi:hypothetical protein BDZ85DRAFT_1545 [Elsinoe ampelina]|uniref:Uncharacterized protein n=1 Tax=Elsinoe ampelina TaxID=302913 RepID=A0A6A6GNQ0_9PEZI|nr:hypothetical protein BDZ85DRAFT_1545 [Elsinoe ampelina]
MAVRCNFTPVLRTLEGHVIRGSLTETTVDTLRLLPEFPRTVSNDSTKNPCSHYLTTSLENIRDHTEFDCAPQPKNSGNHTFAVLDGGLDIENATLSYYDPTCIAYMSNETVRAVTSTVRSLLHERTITTLPHQAQVIGEVRSNDWGSDVSNEDLHLYSLINYGDTTPLDSVDHFASNLADSTMNFFRTNMYRHRVGNEPVIGVAKENKPCVNVRWIWLIYPLIIAALACAFTVSLLWQIHGKGRKYDRPGMLKSSPLALLVYDINVFNHGMYNKPQDSIELELAASKVKTSLVPRRKSSLKNQ